MSGSSAAVLSSPSSSSLVSSSSAGSGSGAESIPSTATTVNHLQEKPGPFFGKTILSALIS